MSDLEGIDMRKIGDPPPDPDPKELKMTVMFRRPSYNGAQRDVYVEEIHFCVADHEPEFDRETLKIVDTEGRVYFYRMAVVIGWVAEVVDA